MISFKTFTEEFDLIQVLTDEDIDEDDNIDVLLDYKDEDVDCKNDDFKFSFE